MSKEITPVADLLEPLWERQPQETSMWFERFQMYLMMGPKRSLRKAYTQYLASQPLKANQKNSVAAHAGQLVPAMDGQWSETAKKWRWQERAQAYDDEQRREELEQQQNARKEMLERHIQQAMEVQHVAFASLATATFEEPRDMLAAWKTAVEVEQKARGIPTALLHIMSMSNDELLQRYNQFLAGVGLSGSGSQAQGLAEQDPFPQTDPDADKPSL